MSERVLVEVCALHQGWIRAELSMFLIDAARERRFDTIVSNADKKPRPNNYNFAANRFMDRWPQPDHLLLLNADCVPYMNLLDLVEHNLDIVSFPMPVARWRQTPLVPIQWNFAALDKSEWKVKYDKEPEEVRRAGSGAMLISRTVLAHKAMRAPFMYTYDERGELLKGLDMNFCDRAREAGFSVFVATSHRCGHINEVDLGELYNIFILQEEVMQSDILSLTNQGDSYKE